MKRLPAKIIAIMMLLTPASGAHAQLKGFMQKMGQQVINSATGNAQQNAQSPRSSSPQSASDVKLTGTVYYVSASTGGARNAGTSKQAPLRDLQKAIDQASDGSTILVAEGNYLGSLDRGYIENGAFGNSTSDRGKYLNIIGGYSADFSQRNPFKYITKIQPNSAEGLPKNALLSYTARRANGYSGPMGEVVIDGLTFDMGECLKYAKPDISNDKTGTPNSGVLSGRLVPPDAAPQYPTFGLTNGQYYGLHIDIDGNITIKNCTFVNCSMMGIQGTVYTGSAEIFNNVFVACRMAGCAVQGGSNDPAKSSLSFHHNTVVFTWARTKENEDMGQGFRFMNRIRTIDCYNNIFACQQRCGVERCIYESDKAAESKKQSNLYNNLFFANKYDLELSNGASGVVNCPASRIEEADQIGPKYEGNKRMDNPESFTKQLDEAYYAGFMDLDIQISSQYNASSTTNQFNRAFGLNQQGTQTVKVSMYANKYPWQKAFQLYGAIPGYGAQAFK